MVPHAPKSVLKPSLMQGKNSKCEGLQDSRPQRLTKTIQVCQWKGGPSHNLEAVVNAIIHKMHCIDTPRWILQKDSLHYNNSIKKTMEKVVAKDLVREAKLVKKNISVVSRNRWSINTLQVRRIADQKRRMILGKSLKSQVKKQISHC